MLLCDVSWILSSLLFRLSQMPQRMGEGARDRRMALPTVRQGHDSNLVSSNSQFPSPLPLTIIIITIIAVNLCTVQVCGIRDFPIRPHGRDAALRVRQLGPGESGCQRDHPDSQRFSADP